MALAFVFPGQGSQSVGMLAEQRAQETILRECFEEADEALSLPLGRIVAEGPEAELNRTEITQPALLTASVGLWRLWSERTPARPSVLAGHSLGEYSALVCGGALRFTDAVRLVHLRGRLMQQAVPAGEGLMAAILGLDEEEIRKCCAAAAEQGVVAPANFNAPGQVVIAGATAAVEAAISHCERAGARRTVKLAVSAPIHCELMAPVARDLAAALDETELVMPRIPVIHNVDAGISADLDGLRDRLLRQLSEPVRWSESVARMCEDSVERVVECGPGKVLAGLIRRIDRSLPVLSLDGRAAFDEALAEVSA